MKGAVRRGSVSRAGMLGFAGGALLGGLLCLAPTAALGAVSLTPCSAIPGFSCGSLTVPLDREGLVGGSISLNLARRQAGATPSRSAVVALAGGPGQAALPFAQVFVRGIGPALATRDLVTFDQRGTGTSDPLSCPALTSRETASEVFGIGVVVELCALQIGEQRRDFTTEESVADIEAIRQALGYEKLVLYGTSYGTKVALRYAERFPQHVEALVLDSVTLPDGPEPFRIPTLQAIRPALEELCSGRACAGIAAHPVEELEELVEELEEARMVGTVYNGHGRPHRTSLSALDMLDILADGDLDPAIRALTPGAVRAALYGDPEPLMQLDRIGNGAVPETPARAQAPKEPSDDGLFLDTTCEETLFPWNRAASAATRRREALSSLMARPRSDLDPLGLELVWYSSLAPLCLHWPDASPAPPPLSALPDVPTLILSGAQDLRTPTADARQTAARIPDAELVVVPYTGHAVIESDLGSCAQSAVLAFFTSQPVEPCAADRNPLPPRPAPPARLRSVNSFPGTRGRAGRTLRAALDTLGYLTDELTAIELELRSPVPLGSRFGGLRGGFDTQTPRGSRLVRFSVVAGVELTGRLALAHGRASGGTFLVDGAGAARGVLHISPRSVRGRLGGVRIRVSRARARMSAAPGEAEWPAPEALPSSALEPLP